MTTLYWLLACEWMVKLDLSACMHSFKDEQIIRVFE